MYINKAYLMDIDNINCVVTTDGQDVKVYAKTFNGIDLTRNEDVIENIKNCFAISKAKHQDLDGLLVPDKEYSFTKFEDEIIDHLLDYYEDSLVYNSEIQAVADILEQFKGQFADYEVYTTDSWNERDDYSDGFSCESCTFLGNGCKETQYTELYREVVMYDFLNNEEYNDKMVSGFSIDFNECFGDKDAAILCILVK